MSSFSDEQRAELDAMIKDQLQEQLAAHGATDAEIKPVESLPVQATYLGRVADFTVWLMKRPLVQVLVFPAALWSTYEFYRPKVPTAYQAVVKVVKQFDEGEITPARARDA